MYFLQSNYYCFVNLSLFDIILVPMILIIVMLWAYMYKRRREEQQVIYRNFHWAIAAKMGAVILFCLAYMIFYSGDTLDYFNSTVAVNHVFFQHSDQYFQMMLNGNKPEYYSYFNAETYYPEGHMFRDPKTFFVIRLISPLVLLCGNSFMISSIIMSLISFIGLWKFYKLLCGLYPSLYKYFFFSALLIPSVLFWGSGLLKDTITMSATAWISYSIFMVFFKRKKLIPNIIAIIVMAFLIISIKPYIFVSLVPGLLIWLFFNQVKRIPNKLIRAFITPLAFLLVLIAAAALLNNMGQYLGVYGDVDSAINKVKVTQEDLLQSSHYGSNNYDIGVIEPSAWGLIKKAPQAIMAGMFRPFLWEARNPFIVVSGLENLSLLILLIFILIKVGLKVFFNAIISDPFLSYAFVFALLFAFGIGLASTNFGALVRYRIPLLPFLVSGLFILFGHYRELKAKKADNK
jgi:hypothetical protein